MEHQDDTEVAQFISNLSLDALMAKLYFELPYSLIFKKLATSPYLAVGVGPGWQTWSRVTINYMEGNIIYNGQPPSATTEDLCKCCMDD